MNQSSLSNPPNEDEAEVSVFGPGYGESIVVHLGSGNWLIVDSCFDYVSKASSPLYYLQKIGVNPSKAVKLVVATHWHDDHVRGLSSVIRECQSARFVCSAALNSNEFFSFVYSLAGRPMMTNSGVEEFSKIIQILKDRIESTRPESRGPEWAVADRPLLKCLPPYIPCTVHALSPSSATMTLALNEIAQEIPSDRETKRRAVALRPNQVAVVLWIAIENISILLGADLEETKDSGTGWSVIVDSTTKPSGRACVFKVPHHGSSSADQPKVWSEMLEKEPFALVTPFVEGGTNLPTRRDTGRICSRTPNAYTSAHPLERHTHKRYGAVEKTIRETVRNIRVISASTGHVRLRRKIYAKNNWTVELFNGALKLRDVYSLK